MLTVAKPQPGEYAPYVIDYINQVPQDGRILQLLNDNFALMKNHIYTLDSDKLTTPHEVGEWTVQEILVHIIDAERVLSYRVLRIARGDTTELPGFEQDDYVTTSNANQRTLDDILEEYEAVRKATLTLLHSLDENVLTQATLTSQNRTSVRALIYIIAGHEYHHLISIKENYG